MWPGPYGDGGSRKYMLGSLDASLRRLRLDYVDIFYSHRFDPETPLEETMERWPRRCTRARPATSGSPTTRRDRPARPRVLDRLGVRLLVHQPAYSMPNRWPDADRSTPSTRWVRCVVYSPLEQGILTHRYLSGVPDGSRASREETLFVAQLDAGTLDKVRALAAIAARRGQTMAQMALAWTQRDPWVTTTLVGASSLAKLEQNVATIDSLGFTTGEARGDRGDPSSRLILHAAGPGPERRVA